MGPPRIRACWAAEASGLAGVAPPHPQGWLGDAGVRQGPPRSWSSPSVQAGVERTARPLRSGPSASQVLTALPWGHSHGRRGTLTVRAQSGDRSLAIREATQRRGSALQPGFGVLDRTERLRLQHMAQLMGHNRGRRKAQPRTPGGWAWISQGCAFSGKR